MIPETTGVVGAIIQGALVVVGLAMAASVVRLVRGPTLPDRVVALDLLGTLSAGAIALYSIITGESTFLPVAIVMALVMFVGTVAFALYLERRARP
jgi:multicomponent Na+:H+ antiporter subunit F